MSDWTSTTLGRVFAVDNTKLGPHDEEPTVMSLSKYDGFVRAEEYFDKRIASSNLDGYKVVEPGEWAFSTIHIDEGSIARNNLGERGVISPMYTTMRLVATDCIPEYAELLVRQPGMLAEYSRRAQGSINRRRSLPFKAFAAIEFRMPGPTEQRRIIDVIAAVDAQIAALNEEAARGWKAWEAVVAGLDVNDGRLQLADGLRSIEAGKSPRGQERLPGPEERAVLKISAVGRAKFHSTEVKTVDASTALPESTRVRSGDVLLVRCNAVLDRVGIVCRVDEVSDNLYLCDKTLRLVADEHVLLPAYLVHAMATPSVREQIARLTAGSDMRNIGQKALREIVVPDPGTEAQGVVAAGLDELVSRTKIIEDEASHLRMFRTSLLTSLLKQEIVIPESYETLLHGSESYNALLEKVF